MRTSRKTTSTIDVLGLPATVAIEDAPGEPGKGAPHRYWLKVTLSLSLLPSKGYLWGDVLTVSQAPNSVSTTKGLLWPAWYIYMHKDIAPNLAELVPAMRDALDREVRRVAAEAGAGGEHG